MVELKILALLKEPHTAGMLRDKSGVTKQRVSQILRKLVAGGRVQRLQIEGERGRYLYLLAEAPANALIVRQPALTRACSTVLSLLTPRTMCRVGDVAAAANLSRQQVTAAITRLVRWKMAEAHRVVADLRRAPATASN